MKTTAHTPREYADAIRALLPPGAAWDWPKDGLGDTMLLNTAEELTRMETAARQILDCAVETHRPHTDSWHISEYQRVAEEALDGLVRQNPGDLVRLYHLIQPARVGSRIGDRLWSARSRYILLVNYDGSAVNAAALLTVAGALSVFKQAHVFVWFHDISRGENYAPH